MDHSEYITVCSFNNVEFGYYECSDGGCVDEFKVVVRFWDKTKNFLDEKILSFEDSPGEAVESISPHLKKGVVFQNVYGAQTFPGGLELVFRDGQHAPIKI